MGTSTLLLHSLKTLRIPWPITIIPSPIYLSYMQLKIETNCQVNLPIPWILCNSLHHELTMVCQVLKNIMAILEFLLVIGSSPMPIKKFFS
jgi:hypothetical protein